MGKRYIGQNECRCDSAEFVWFFLEKLEWISRIGWSVETHADSHWTRWIFTLNSLKCRLDGISAFFSAGTAVYMCLRETTSAMACIAEQFCVFRHKCAWTTDWADSSNLLERFSPINTSAYVCHLRLWLLLDIGAYIYTATTSRIFVWKFNCFGSNGWSGISAHCLGWRNGVFVIREDDSIAYRMKTYAAEHNCEYLHWNSWVVPDHMDLLESEWIYLVDPTAYSCHLIGNRLIGADAHATKSHYEFMCENSWIGSDEIGWYCDVFSMGMMAKPIENKLPNGMV